MGQERTTARRISLCAWVPTFACGTLHTLGRIVVSITRSCATIRDLDTGRCTQIALESDVERLEGQRTFVRPSDDSNTTDTDDP